MYSMTSKRGVSAAAVKARRTQCEAGVKSRCAAAFSTHLRPARDRHPCLEVRHPDSGEVEEIVVTLRADGALVYTAHLATTADRHRRDTRPFRRVLRSFRIEPRR